MSRLEIKSLGKGLSALIPPKKSDELISSLEINKEGNVNYLKLGLIKDNRFQPRQDYDEAKLADLKASIKEKGVLQPILVRPANNAYEVVAGQRRLHACRALGLDQIPVVIKNVSDREALVLALVENIQREELNPIEEAQGFKRLIEEFHFTQESVAQSVGKDRTTVTNLLRLLKLPQEIHKHVAQGSLSGGHARALLSLQDVTLQKKMADEIIVKGLSVRQVEAMVKRALRDKGSNRGERPLAPTTKDRDIQILEEELCRALGTKVSVVNKNNQGTLIIEYYSLDDLDRILGIIRRSQ